MRGLNQIIADNNTADLQAQVVAGLAAGYHVVVEFEGVHMMEVTRFESGPGAARVVDLINNDHEYSRRAVRHEPRSM